jgi:hypothetical protein
MMYVIYTGIRESTDTYLGTWTGGQTNVVGTVVNKRADAARYMGRAVGYIRYVHTSMHRRGVGPTSRKVLAHGYVKILCNLLVLGINYLMPW